jgi:Plasmid pRiA4b ORF-3-like protein
VPGHGPGIKKVTYIYDFGTSWHHEIMLERAGEREAGRAYPACVAVRGDSPVDYWSEEDPTDAEPFDLAEANGRLAATTEHTAQEEEGSG